ncbi:hypothetical protein HUU05_15405 [candidate division KSB1 bacterium]|nr:hypothetical protein [candidate division KSB1 bacterium]
MITKEQLHSEIDNLSDEYNDELYSVIKSFAAVRGNGRKPSFMSKLKSIKIDAPEDFAANLELYMNGEKRVEPHLR